MNKVTKEQIKKLALNITRAGKVISEDSISKDYTIGDGIKHSIIVTSDSGYEAIYIGNLESKNTDGYMCLYTNNTSIRNSYPSTPEIELLLTDVLIMQKLEIGEGKASYYDWEEYGGMKKQLKYYSNIVSRLAKLEVRTCI